MTENNASEEVSALARRYLEMICDGQKASSELLRRQLLSRFDALSTEEKFTLYCKNTDNSVWLKTAEESQKNWEIIEYLEKIYLDALRDVLTKEFNAIGKGDRVNSIRKASAVDLAIKTLLPSYEWKLLMRGRAEEQPIP